MALERVSFNKARGHQPLVNPLPPSKGGPSHPERFWTEDEIVILQRDYETKGPVACQIQMPRHNLRTIYQRAQSLGLRAPRQKKPGQLRQRHTLTQDQEDEIKRRWPLLKGRGAVMALADDMGIPRWVVSKRATALGLAIPHQKEPAWSAAELQLLDKVPLHSPTTAARIFQEHGFHRTPTSIIVKSKRLGMSRRYTETLSATQVAEILGIDSKTATLYCIDGSLKATRRDTKRGPQQGGHPWSITPADLRQFVLDNLERIDIRKVEKFSFVKILTLQTEKTP